MIRRRAKTSLQVTPQAVIAKDTLPLSLFTHLVERHLALVAGTRELEAEGARLITLNFAETALRQFIQGVCYWGGYAGIAGRVLKNNSAVGIRSCFLTALGNLTTLNSDVGLALFSVNGISGLGTPSFASKHLRFLRPDVCPVLDSVVSDELRYRFDRGGYKMYADDCLKITSLLQSQVIANPMDRPDGGWFAGDVDMAIFAHLRGW